MHQMFPFRESLQSSSPTEVVADSSSNADHRLVIVQQPKLSKVTTTKEKDRKPIDPPPIVQLEVAKSQDPRGMFLSSPYYFMTCHLIRIKRNAPTGQNPSGEIVSEERVHGNQLFGTVVSSLHRLKDPQNRDVAYFVFSDVSVKDVGEFRLAFTLYDLQRRKEGGDECAELGFIKSDPFSVWSAKLFPGMEESTFLTRAISDQGVRVRLRKDSRQSQTQKRSARYVDTSRDQYHQVQQDQLKRRRTMEDAALYGGKAGRGSISPGQHLSPTSSTGYSAMGSTLSPIQTQHSAFAGYGSHMSQPRRFMPPAVLGVSASPTQHPGQAFMQTPPPTGGIESPAFYNPFSSIDQQMTQPNPYQSADDAQQGQGGASVFHSSQHGYHHQNHPA